MVAAGNQSGQTIYAHYLCLIAIPVYMFNGCLKYLWLNHPISINYDSDSLPPVFGTQSVIIQYVHIHITS